MIEFEKTNEKGDSLKAFTHINYLSKHYKQQISRIERRNQTWSGVTLFGSFIATYWLANNVHAVNNIVQNKLSWKGRFLIVSAGTGMVNSFLMSFILTKSLRSTHQDLLKKQVFPAWFQRERVVNPDRVFFELDDNTHNEPTIWHSGITQSSIQNIIPDFVIGTVEKPHYPVAQHHHH